MLNGNILSRRLLVLISPVRRRHQPLIRAPWTRRNLLTLAIETSCDDTAVAILESHKCNALPAESSQQEAVLHFNEKITARNTGLGGIHPVEALESHRANLSKLIAEALLSLPNTERQDAKSLRFSNGGLKKKPDFISVTRGPGMRSNLACGLDTAKGLSVAWQVPLLGVHHMQAHALTPRLISVLREKNNTTGVSALTTAPKVTPKFPFLTLLVSGGHTMLVHSSSLVEHEIMATTYDIAIGDALDKCGRMLLLDEDTGKMEDTAFAKHLSKYAFPSIESFASYSIPKSRDEEQKKLLNRFGWQVRPSLTETRDLAFSFTGLVSAVERIFGQRSVAASGHIDSEERLLLAQAAVGAAFEHLGSRTLIALEQLRKMDVHIPTLVVSGGVAANDFLRYFLRAFLDVRGYKDIGLVFPPVEFCTDNAAMIAWCGLEMYDAGFRSDLAINPLRKWSMDASIADEGILGVPGWEQIQPQ